MMRAGITKDITFHCARHTFAVLQLTLGTEIFTLSKLLGHSELKTTQIYAKIIDEKKREAVNKIPDISIDINFDSIPKKLSNENKLINYINKINSSK
jgi:hypothetical protein